MDYKIPYPTHNLAGSQLMFTDTCHSWCMWHQ